MSSYYEFQLPEKILSGDGALEHVPHELTLLGAGRPLLLSDRGYPSPYPTGIVAIFVSASVT